MYENALAHDVSKSGLQVQQEVPIWVFYDGIVVGEYSADLFVEELVIVEFKLVRALDDIHMAQCLNYLRATGMPVCLLINFGRPRIEVKRIIPNDLWRTPKP